MRTASLQRAGRARRQELNVEVCESVPNEGLCFRNTRLLRQLDEAAVGVAHVGGATPREVARPVQRDARRGQRGGVLVEAFER